jgi:hypothetical protein
VHDAVAYVPPLLKVISLLSCKSRPFDNHLRLATFERIARYTVWIAVEKNTGVGTGTLIAVGKDRHVVAGVNVRMINFWMRPPAALIEKHALDTTSSEVGRLSVEDHRG